VSLVRVSLVSTRQELVLQTANNCPPIPDRSYDWSAIDYETYDGTGYVAHGATEAAAVIRYLEEQDTWQR
jgi:hypothetical protein